MRSLVKTSLYLSFFLYSVNLSAKTQGCLNAGKVKFKTETRLETYCFDTKKKQIMPMRCMVDQASCLASSLRDKKITIKLTNFASPNYLACKKLKGEPQRIKYWDEKSWQKVAICLFKDGSYIDLERLYSYNQVEY